MRISIIGSGVVGKATGIGFHRHGNDVIFHDIIKEKLFMLKKQGYEVTEDQLEAIHNSSISFICVQTPTLNGKMDFSYVKKAIVGIAKTLRKKRKYHLIVIRSTVLPSTTRTKIIPLLRKHSRLIPGKEFGVCVNPEFMKRASALNGFLNPWRILIGEFDKRSGDVLETLYSPFKVSVIRADLDTAEMIKYVANTFLATKISFFNEFFIICKKLGLDPHFVAKVVSLDPRIGEYGIYGGRSFKGSCLPKDLEAFINFTKDKKLNPKLLDAVSLINKKMKKCESLTAKAHE
ncbi:MAG: UDP-glucose/GDP-mannose dehydrogenase family protein [Candidatus Bathyarchaeota archaeon]|nr:MAG: UDP-glucose/GDP-mannose dehydrogenase family protein [Candidatus Bathyarchaeota archaeon]